MRTFLALPCCIITVEASSRYKVHPFLQKYHQIKVCVARMECKLVSIASVALLQAHWHVKEA